jgi:hypothetical protein
VVKVGNIILENRPWKGLWPIALGINTPIPFRWWGMSDVEPLREDQDTLNDFISMVQDHVREFIHPRIKGVATSVINPKSLKGSPDQVIWMNEGRMGDLEYWQPGNMGTDLYNGMDKVERNMETTVGLAGQHLSRAAGKAQTATETQMLDRAGRGRIGLLSSLFDEFISRLYLLTAECIQNNYDPGRKVRILGESGQASVVEISQGHRDVTFDVEIEAGSTLPYDKQARKLDVQYLFSILNRAVLPELLEIYSDVVKNKEEVMQRDQLWQQFQQMIPLMQDPAFMEMVGQYMALTQEATNGQGQPGAN